MKHFFEWVAHICIGWWNRIFEKEEQLYKERLKVCESCESKIRFTKSEYICKECGCPLKSKLRVPEESCLLGKW